MSDDDITLTPEYEFEFDDHQNRSSTEIDGGEKFPEAIEALAQLGREDPECEVTLVGFAN